jgi:hypothetical protein
MATLLPKTARRRGAELSVRFRPHSEEALLRFTRHAKTIVIIATGFTDWRECRFKEKSMSWISVFGRALEACLIASLLVWTVPVAADVTEEMEMTPSAQDMPTVVPSKQETSESVFAKLDAGKKGYISTADVGVLPGFDKIFPSADGDHDGKLSLKEFKGAWATYSGTTDPSVDAPGVQ